MAAAETVPQRTGCLNEFPDLVMFVSYPVSVCVIGLISGKGDLKPPAGAVNTMQV
jgi:hypothetical protein